MYVINYRRPGNIRVKISSQVKSSLHKIFVVLGNHKIFERVVSFAHIKWKFTSKLAVLEAITFYQHILVSFCGSLFSGKHHQLSLLSLRDP